MRSPMLINWRLQNGGKPFHCPRSGYLFVDPESGIPVTTCNWDCPLREKCPWFGCAYPVAMAPRINKPLTQEERLAVAYAWLMTEGFVPSD